jgi:hypothetical protein
MFKHTALDQIVVVVGTQAHLHAGAGLMRVGKMCPSEREAGPTIFAMLERGPLAGRRIGVDVVGGRPPKTIDLRADDGSSYRCWSRGLGPERSVRDLHVLVSRVARSATVAARSVAGDSERQHDDPGAALSTAADDAA